MSSPSILETLAQTGVKFFDVTFSDKVMNYFLNLSERDELEGYKEAVEGLGTYEVFFKNYHITPYVVEGFPKELQDFLVDYELHFMAYKCEEGYELSPHRDFFDGFKTYNEKIEDVMALMHIVFWVTPFEFEGREFVWGNIENAHIYKKDFLSWDDPNLKQLGSIKPQTGKAVIIDTFNSQFWHGVKRLESGGPIFRGRIIVAPQGD
jgi:hypothetical protein